MPLGRDSAHDVLVIEHPGANQEKGGVDLRRGETVEDARCVGARAVVEGERDDRPGAAPMANRPSEIQLSVLAVLASAEKPSESWPTIWM